MAFWHVISILTLLQLDRPFVINGGHGHYALSGNHIVLSQYTFYLLLSYDTSFTFKRLVLHKELSSHHLIPTSNLLLPPDPYEVTPHPYDSSRVMDTRFRDVLYIGLLMITD